MRASQFIVEYRRDITVGPLKDKILTAMANDRHLFAVDELGFNVQSLMKMASDPDNYHTKTLRYSILGKMYSVSIYNAKELLAQLTPQILDVMMSKFESADPSPNKQYTPWLTRMYANGQISIEDVLSTASEYLYKFYQLNRRKKIPAPQNDIMRYTNINEFYKTVESLPDIEDVTVDRGDATEVYSDATVRVIIPNNEAAACYYGRGTRWCTAATRANNYFNRYNSEGTIYILLPKKPEYDGEKYQLHFESEQSMDETDSHVSLSKLLKSRFPSLIPFFLEQNPDITELIAFASDEDIQKILDEIKSPYYDAINDQLSEYEYSDDYYWKWLKDEGYVDDNGSVDFERADNDGKDYLSANDEVRRWYNDAIDVLDQTPANIRAYADDMGESSESDPDLMYMPYVLKQIADDTIRDKDTVKWFNSWIDDNIRMRIGQEGKAFVHVLKNKR